MFLVLNRAGKKVIVNPNCIQSIKVEKDTKNFTFRTKIQMNGYFEFVDEKLEDIYTMIKNVGVVIIPTDVQFSEDDLVPTIEDRMDKDRTFSKVPQRSYNNYNRTYNNDYRSSTNREESYNNRW